MSSLKYVVIALATWALACGDSSGNDASDAKRDGGSKTTNDAAQGTPRDDGGAESGGARASGQALPPSGKADAGQSDTSRPADPDTSDPGSPSSSGTGAPTEASDAGPPVATSGAQTDGGVVHGSGSCCTEHTTPGCSNADLEVCVCEKDPSCCTTAWGRQCTFIVEQKYCQPNVRDCVCGTGTDHWNQPQCCDSAWSSTCDSVAKLKCNAVQGCF